MLTALTKNADILKALYFGGALSCAEISSKVGKSIPNVTRLLADLITSGYVSEKGIGSSSGGRKPVTYCLVAKKRYILSIAMDQLFTRIVLLDMQNSFATGVHEFPLNLHESTIAQELLVKEINEVIELSDIDRSKIIGAGIAMPGFVDLEKGVNHSFLKMPGSNFRQYVSEKINLPVFIDNDSSAIALAELKFGASISRREIMVINIGWGIGLGMIVNGEIFRGYSGFAGEFSHIPLFQNNKMCSCGKSGCLETEASLIEIEKKAVEGIGKGQVTQLKHSAAYPISIDDIIAAAEQGDLFSIKLISEAGYHIGRALAILIHIMNPEIIVLSGKGSLAGKLWLAPVQQAINEHCIPRLASYTHITVSQLGINAELIGAAALVLENIHHLE